MSANIKKIEQVSKTLQTALAQPRLEYRNHYRKYVSEQVDKLAALLAANNMNLDLVAPYPASYGPTYKGRNAYIAALELHQFATRFFSGDRPWRGSNDPYTVAPRADREQTLDKMADEATRKHFDGYQVKLACKIGKDIASAKLVGSLWSNSILSVTTTDGENQVWHTQCIFNVSCLGRVFNQWPTRRKV